MRLPTLEEMSFGKTCNYTRIPASNHLNLFLQVILLIHTSATWNRIENKQVTEVDKTVCESGHECSGCTLGNSLVLSSSGSSNSVCTVMCSKFTEKATNIDVSINCFYSVKKPKISFV